MQGKFFDFRNFAIGTGEKIVFVTSERYDGALGGLDGADAICQEHADSAGLLGTYRAWLSNSTTSVSQRFDRDFDNAAFVRTDGVRVANNWADLTNGQIQRNLNMSEFGSPILQTNYANTVAWTGTSAGGLYVGPDDDGNHQDCNSWGSSSSTSKGWQGRITARNGAWSDFENRGCNTEKRLYCFQQVSATTSKIWH